MQRRAFLSGVGAAALASLSGCSTLGRGTSDGPLNLVTVDQPPHFQAVVMDREGYGDQLPVAIDRDRSTPTSASGLLVSGKADVAMLGIVPALVAITTGPPASIVSASSKEAFVVLMRENAAPYFDGPDSGGVSAFRESTGRKLRLGTYPTGSSSDITARYWLNEVREADLANVNLVPLDGAGASRQALLAGEVDGAVIPEPTPTLIEETADVSATRVGTVGDFIPGMPAGVTVVRDEYASAHPEIIEAFLEAHADASRFIEQNPETAATYLSDAFGGERALDPEIARLALDSPASEYVTDPHQIVDGTAVVAAYAARLGKLEQAPETEQVIDTTFYDRVMG